MMDHQERELRAALRRVAVQEPPVSLRERARAIASQPSANRRAMGATRLLPLGFAGLALSIGALFVLTGGPRSFAPPPPATAAPLPSPASAPPPTPAPTEVQVVDGLDVMTVSEAIAARDAEVLPDGRAAIRGYWSNGYQPFSCMGFGNHGELGLWCTDGASGITELNEQIYVVARGGQVTAAKGPNLTPYFPDDVEGVDLMVHHPQFINGQLYPPFPVVLLGHFHDPRAKDCVESARQKCLDRFVVDRIVRWDAGAVATPGITPTPSPFPSPPPPGMFEASDCKGDIPYSFIGWTTFEELGFDDMPNEQIWVAISRDKVERTDEWQDHPSGNRYRVFARVVCYRYEWEGRDAGGMSFATLPGTEETRWEDGQVTPDRPPVLP